MDRAIEPAIPSGPAGNDGDAACAVWMNYFDGGLKCGRPLHNAPAGADPTPVCLMHSNDPGRQIGLLFDEFRKQFETILKDAGDGSARCERFVFPRVDLRGHTIKAICQFVRATFTQEAAFSGTAFTQEPQFGGAPFSSALSLRRRNFQKAPPSPEPHSPTSLCSEKRSSTEVATSSSPRSFRTLTSARLSSTATPCSLAQASPCPQISTGRHSPLIHASPERSLSRRQTLWRQHFSKPPTGAPRSFLRTQSSDAQSSILRSLASPARSLLWLSLRTRAASSSTTLISPAHSSTIAMSVRSGSPPLCVGETGTGIGGATWERRYSRRSSLSTRSTARISNATASETTAPSLRSINNSKRTTMRGSITGRGTNSTLAKWRCSASPEHRKDTSPARGVGRTATSTSLLFTVGAATMATVIGSQ